MAIKTPIVRKWLEIKIFAVDQISLSLITTLYS